LKIIARIVTYKHSRAVAGEGMVRLKKNYSSQGKVREC